MEGSVFKTYIENMSLTDRENAIIQEVTTGNIPNFMRNLVPVTVSTTINSQSHTAIYHVIPDYLAVGSDTDYFLMPMTPLTAQKIADALSCNLPTRKMVNDIWSKASVKLSPAPIPPSPEMTTVPVFWDHNTIVRAQRAAYLGSNPLGHLVGGDKKDVVVTKLLATNTRKVAIYGWHYTSGTPIQNLYLGHDEYYADYSHGIRLVKSIMTLDGNTTTIPNILQDTTYNVLLSDEGVVTTYRYPVLSRLNFPDQDSFPSTPLALRVGNGAAGYRRVADDFRGGTDDDQAVQGLVIMRPEEIRGQVIFLFVLSMVKEYFLFQRAFCKHSSFEIFIYYFSTNKYGWNRKKYIPCPPIAVPLLPPYCLQL